MRDFVRGRTAESPLQIPRAGWIEVFKRTWAQTWVDNISLVAAGVAFYGFLAFVPLLAAVILLFGLVAEPAAAADTLRMLFAAFPNDIAAFVGEQLLTVVRTSQGTKGLALAIALAVSLYGASNGAWALITALNIAYEEKEKRSWWQVYLLAFTITFAAIAAALAAVAATTLVATLDTLLPSVHGVFIAVGRIAAYALLALVAAAAAATLYRWGPSREHARWRWITPGSAFSAILWVVLSAVFGFYATRVANFSATYGSLAAVAGFLTWLYLSAYAFLFGAELNSELEHQTARDSTTGAPERMGERGAWAADNVAEGEEADVAEAPSLAKASPAAAEQRKSDAEKGEGN